MYICTHVLMLVVTGYALFNLLKILLLLGIPSLPDDLVVQGYHCHPSLQDHLCVLLFPLGQAVQSFLVNQAIHVLPKTIQATLEKREKIVFSHDTENT